MEHSILLEVGLVEFSFAGFSLSKDSDITWMLIGGKHVVLIGKFRIVSKYGGCKSTLGERCEV